MVFLGFILLVMAIFSGLESYQFLYRANYDEHGGCWKALVGLLAAAFTCIALSVGLYLVVYQ
jgi:hypothetical protein